MKRVSISAKHIPIVKSYVLLVLFCSFLTSCGKKGAWEYFTWRYELGKSTYHYSCDNGKANDYQQDEDNIFWEGMTCQELGYTISLPKSERVWGQYVATNDGSYPGANGKWGTNSSSSGDPCSLSNYKGPTSDVQSASFCQTAFVYKCKGNAAGVKSSCATYTQFRQVNSKLPACPYCN